MLPASAPRTPSYQFQFSSTDGLRIACVRWDTCGLARGVVQIADGMGEHIGRYDGLIELLVESGVVVDGNDHRGHGRTAPSPKALGDFGDGGFCLLAQDMFQLTLIAKKENLGYRVSCWGTAWDLLRRNCTRSITAVSSPGLALSGSGALDGLVQLAKSAPQGEENILNRAFQPARTPFDWLSRETAVVDAFMNDPSCFGALRPSSTESFWPPPPFLPTLPVSNIRSDLPIYLCAGSDDPGGQRLEGLRILIERYRAVGVQNLSHDFYPGGRHEMLNEVNRAEVRANLLRWISSVLEAHASKEAS